jgi:hypothetical protein
MLQDHAKMRTLAIFVGLEVVLSRGAHCWGSAELCMSAACIINDNPAEIAGFSARVRAWTAPEAGSGSPTSVLVSPIAFPEEELGMGPPAHKISVYHDKHNSIRINYYQLQPEPVKTSRWDQKRRPKLQR